MTQLELYLSIARKYIGITENSPQFREIIKSYNTIKPLPRGYKMKLTDEWCAAFVSSIAQMIHKRDFPFECSAHRMLEKTKYTLQPELGYLIFYDWNKDKWADHVGIVSKVNKSSIHVIEGNNNSRVIERTVKIDDPNIRGYGVVSWATTSIDNKKELPDDELYITLAKDCMAGKYGNGITRQHNIEKLGFNYKLVQEYVNRFYKG